MGQQPESHAAHESRTTENPELKNEGEGSRSAARRYDANAEKAAKDKKKVEKLATEAQKALEGPEGESLREADRKGKRGEHS